MRRVLLCWLGTDDGLTRSRWLIKQDRKHRHTSKAPYDRSLFSLPAQSYCNSLRLWGKREFGGRSHRYYSTHHGTPPHHWFDLTQSPTVMFLTHASAQSTHGMIRLGTSCSSLNNSSPCKWHTSFYFCCPLSPNFCCRTSPLSIAWFLRRQTCYNYTRMYSKI